MLIITIRLAHHAMSITRRAARHFLRTIERTTCCTLALLHNLACSIHSHNTVRYRMLAGPLLIITGISVLLGIAIVSLLFQKELSATFLFLFVEMPRFDVLAAPGESTDPDSALYSMYFNFRTISFFVMSIAVVVAGLSFGMETVNLVPPKLGSKILSNGMLYLIIIMVFPHFWDMAANVVEWTSLWILNPEDPSMAHDTVGKLLSYMSPGAYPSADYARIFGGAGTSIADATFTTIVNFVTAQDGGNALQAIGESYQRQITAFLTEVILFFLKAIALLTMSLTAFLLGTVRYVLTGLLAVGVPLILALSLIPQFTRVTNLMRDTLIALMIVPVFSALAISAGVAVLADLDSGSFGMVKIFINPEDIGSDTLDCDLNVESSNDACDDINTMTPPPAIQELTHGIRKFFMALAVLVLAIYFPAMLAPMISNVMSSVQQHVSTTGVAGSIAATGMQATISHSATSVRWGLGHTRRAGGRMIDLIRWGRGIPSREQDPLFTRISMQKHRPASFMRSGNKPSISQHLDPKLSATNNTPNDTTLSGRPKIPERSTKG